MSEKVNLLFRETKKLYQSKSNIGIKDFETIIKKISPMTSVRLFSEIPLGSNISPRTCAYYSQRANINPNLGEMVVDNKIIYLNFANSTSLSRLTLFSDFIHEAIKSIPNSYFTSLSALKKYF